MVQLDWDQLQFVVEHPQERVYEEQMEVFGGDADANVQHDDLQKMKLTEACIKEALRLFPSVPLIGR